MKASVFVVLSFALVLSLVLLLSTTGVAAQPGEINVDELIDLHNSHVDHSEEAENDLDHVRKYHPERVAELENKLKLLQEQKQQLVTPLQKGVVNVLTEANFDSLIATRELVMVNFYADWCRFSQMLNPIYDGTASHLGQLDVGERIVLAKVNSEMEKALAMRFKITKYPTLKLFRDGKLLRKEYRGERSAAAIIDFLSQLLVKEPVKRFNSVADLHAIQSQSNKEIITVIREDMKNSQFFEAFKEVAAILNEDCAFYYTTNVEEAAKMGMEPSKVYFNSRGSALESFNKDWNQEEFKSWATSKCIPLVREITFENAEALTEEQLPFLILFYSPDNRRPVEIFTRVVTEHFTADRASFNFIVADGHKFAHPLHHLGKHANDLPVLAIDSFQHMYAFENFNQIENPSFLRQFIAEFHNGKLHQDFHNRQAEAPHGGGGHDHRHDNNGGHIPPPGEAPQPPQGQPPQAQQQHQQQQQPPQAQQQQQQHQQQQTGDKKIVESSFKKLLPSKNRYTLLRDEL